MKDELDTMAARSVAALTTEVAVDADEIEARLAATHAAASHPVVNDRTRTSSRRRAFVVLSAAAAVIAVVISVVFVVRGRSTHQIRSNDTAPTTNEATTTTTPELPTIDLQPGWNRLPVGPLSPRTFATAVTVGDQVVVLGGGEDVCDAGSNCVPNGRNFADGAAFDVVSGEWRKIADAPVELGGVWAAIVGPDVYVIPQPATQPPTLLRYRTDADAWDRIDGVPDDAGSTVVARGGDIVIHHPDVANTGSDWRYEPDTQTWVELTDRIRLDERPAIAPRLDNRSRAAMTSVGANEFMFGGQDWSTGAAVLLNDAWLWVAPPAGVLDNVPFELLDVRPATRPMGTLRSAVNPEQLAVLWGDAAAPDVDLRRWIVVSVVIPNNACPPALAGFDQLADNELTPRFASFEEGCDDPLIPKEYIAAIDRVAVGAGFTLHLAADPPYFADEQRLEVLVPRTDPPAALVDEQPLLGEAEVFDAPAPGRATSVLLADGTPVWIVRHLDGSVSAVPAVTASAFAETSTLPDLWQLVRWSPSGHAFVGAYHWDEWGRALNAGRRYDLAGFSAHLDGDRVMVRPNGLNRVPGSPLVTPGVAEQVRPTLPQTIGLDGINGPRWVQVAETLVLHDGVARLCIVDPNVRFDLMQPCPESAPDLPEIEFESAPCATSWYFGPTLLHVDEHGEVTELITMGGSSSRLDSVIPGNCTPPATV